MLKGLAREAIGRPTISGPYDRSRHRVILREVDGKLLICAVDARPELEPETLAIRVAGREVSITPDPAETVLVP